MQSWVLMKRRVAARPLEYHVISLKHGLTLIISLIYQLEDLIILGLTVEGEDLTLT